jgi:hypothetical protein
MTLLFYLILVLAAIASAPLYVFLRTYYGWRFGLVLLFAWVVGLLIMPGGIEAIEKLTGPLLSRHYSPRPFWARVGGATSLLPGIRIQYDLLSWMFLGGLLLWPVHLLLMLIARFNNAPPGSIGLGFRPLHVFQLTFIACGGLLAAAVLGELPLAANLVPVLAMVPAVALLLVMGGIHGRMLGLDKPLTIGIGRKASGADGLSEPSPVRLTEHGLANAGGLDAVFAQRTDAIKQIIRNP